jgi:hypothetical protein
MKAAAKRLEFRQATTLRYRIKTLRAQQLYRQAEKQVGQALVPVLARRRQSAWPDKRVWPTGHGRSDFSRQQLLEA